MGDVYFYFDESGVQGYVANQPTDKDFGIICGYAFKVAELQRLEAETDRILGPLKASCVKNQVKVHSRELVVHKDEALRSEFFQTREAVRGLLLRERISIFHEAIYAKGFFQDNQRAETTKKNAMKTRRSPVQITSHFLPDLLYERIVENLLLKLDEWNQSEGFKGMAIVSDQIDQDLEKKIKKSLAELSKNTLEVPVKGWDPRIQKPVMGKVQVSITNFDNSVKTITDVLIDRANSSLTIVADILCNDVYRHIRQKVENDPSHGLNSHRVMEGFPLKGKMPFLDDDDIIDKLYSPS